ncbi:MAG: hypothetical protein A2X08_17410 [Bacteroidetes bacterium GWA2_32_17]|nr:MAG: hypothetical protein A2X08_17410 [Bacteroidetes bacterium GWA2_32_17]
MLILILLFTKALIAQCNCEKIKRDDGAIINMCPSLPVASDKTTEIGLAAASNGGESFLTITIRFNNVAINVKSKITIRLVDNNLFSLEIINSGLSYIGNSQVTQAVFSLTESNIDLLKKSNLKTISFTMEDNLLHTYGIIANADIIKKQLFCL